MEIKQSPEVQIDNSKAIRDHIVSGTVVVSSPDVLLKLIDQYPLEPLLHRYYADFQTKNGLNDTAAKSYSKAAKLFIDAGMLLQAVVAKISEWRVKPPTEQKVELFISSIKNGNFKENRLNRFLKGLSTSEAISLFPLFEMIQFPSEYGIKAPGEDENELFLIVSGQIRDSIYLTLENTGKVFRKPTNLLSESDFFGDIYPFDEEKKSHSYIETISPAEVIKISKANLAKICREDNNLEVGIMDLLGTRSQATEQDLAHKTRKATRYNVRQQLNIEIYPQESIHSPVSLTGYSQDISIGGMGIVLDPQAIIDTNNVSGFSKTIVQAKTKISLAVETVSLNITGKVRWCREIVDNGQKTLAIGIQFDKISPKTIYILMSLFGV